MLLSTADEAKIYREFKAVSQFQAGLHLCKVELLSPAFFYGPSVEVAWLEDKAWIKRKGIPIALSSPKKAIIIKARIEITYQITYSER